MGAVFVLLVEQAYKKDFSTGSNTQLGDGAMLLTSEEITSAFYYMGGKKIR